MEASEPLPSDVASLIGDHVRSVNEIELLAAMTDVPDRWWDARLVFAEPGIPATAARARRYAEASSVLVETAL